MRANKPTEEKQFEGPNEPANEKAAPEAIASGAFFTARFYIERYDSDILKQEEQKVTH